MFVERDLSVPPGKLLYDIVLCKLLYYLYCLFTVGHQCLPGGSGGKDLLANAM